MNINSLVFFSVVSQDQILELDFHLDPLLVCERGPDVMGLRDGGLVRLQQDLSSLRVDVQGTEDEDQTGKGLKKRKIR